MTVLLTQASPWPWSSEMPSLAALPTAASAARAHVRAALAAWDMSHLADDAALVLSELVGNAVKASAGQDGKPLYVGGQMPVITLCLKTDRLMLLCEVWDQAPGRPVLLRPGSNAESGRGLWTVSELSAQWGWHPATGRGKCVWAVMDARPATDA